TVVFLNDGQRALQTPGTNLGAPGGGVAVAVLDWNQDGAPDIAVASGNSFPDTLYLNDGLGGFTRAIELPSSQSRRIISTDLDSDGLAELVVSGALGTHIVRNNGQGGAEQVQIHESVGLDLTTGDIDGDGFPDLVIVEAGNRFVHVLVNAGDAFTASAFDYGSVAGVNLSDVDGDGAPDLLLAIDGANLSVPQNLVLRNLVNGQFEDWALVGAAPTLKFLAGDVDRNGIADLVAINQTGVHQIFLGDGLGGYTLAEEHILSLGIRKGILIDINGDGSLDLLLAGEDANRVDIHANDGLGKFGRGDVTPPVMTLLGAPTVVIDSGDTFVDPGAAATDNIDGDITANVEVQGSVDSTLLGSYTLTYFVSDIAGNTAAVSRIVTVAARAEGGGGGGSFGWVSLLALCALAAARRRTRPRGS
ncbi:MAG TPA: FG-GAP-like repeat-containing protein, partial [Gammaproteobacteria bacterium]